MEQNENTGRPKASGPMAWLARLWQAVKGLRKRPAPQPEEAPSPETAADQPEAMRLPAQESSLYRLYRLINNLPPVQLEDSYDPMMFLQTGTGGDAPEGWLAALEKRAVDWLALTAREEEEPVDAGVVVLVAPDRMCAWLCLFPPAFDGRELQPEDVMAALEEHGVAYGVDEDKIAALCENKQYLRLVPVAAGTPPVDGEDGRIEDHYRRSIEINLTLRDDGTIDYKDLGWLQVIYAGDVICDIIPPQEAVHGTDVRGGEVRGRDGKKAQPPKGQNTAINADGTALVATIEGVVTFLSNSFRVDPLLIIKGNVDISVGSLDVVGDVLVYGDVLEGFAIKATGNVTVQGMVEGATVVSGGDVQVGSGMNGNSIGTMTAGHEVRCKFIENATVQAGARILCDTIINSTVSSDTAIEVKTGRGAIVGGSISAGMRIDALSIGNHSNRAISITMGNSAAWLRERKEQLEKRAEMVASIEGLKKNIAYLAEKDGNTDKPGGLQGELRLQLSVQQMQLAGAERRLAELAEREVRSDDCRLRAEVIHPPAQVTIGNVTKALRETYYNALVYLKDGDVHVANV